MLGRLALAVAGVFCVVGMGSSSSDPPRGPIIDMHLHALAIGEFAAGESPFVCLDNLRLVWKGWDPKAPFVSAAAGTCAGELVPAPRNDDELLRQTLDALDRFEIRRAVTAGPPALVDAWHEAAPGRIVRAMNFRSGRDAQGRATYHDAAELRRWFAEGRFEVFAEIAPQYYGQSPADPALAPLFALAEELDVPVGLHMGEGPPGGPNFEGYEQYRVAYGRPLLLEELLTRHPKLRLYVMHFGSPLVDEMIAILYSYPQVYVDVAQNNWGFPRRQFHEQLRRLVDAGFGERILFGSDQMIWPATIGLAIDTMDVADFLTPDQKRDIYCRNAARFLRLDAAICQ